jgi:hypothetical protein
MEKELHFPPPIEPLACYDGEQVAALTGVGLRTVERWDLQWFYLGTNTRRIMGRDLLMFLAVRRERDTGLPAEDIAA